MFITITDVKRIRETIRFTSGAGGGAKGAMAPPNLVKTSQKNMAAVHSRKFRKSCGPP